ncbi:MAG: undecaprenyl-phosphate glucose phosphotransferase [Alphaproteobacteria bacterium]|nr:undecaprenyl-phosphate glucose phosphotransferase [Alphaproteobacteria bacterium]
MLDQTLANGGVAKADLSGRAASTISSLIGAPSAVRSRWSRKVAADVIGFGDVLIIIVALAVPCMLLTTLAEQFPRRLELVRSGLLASLIAYGCFCHWRLYDTRTMSAFPVNPARIVLSIAIAMLAVIGISVPVGAPTIMMLVTWPLIWFGSASALLIAYRLMTREILAKLAKRSFFDERIAVYGNGRIARRVRSYVRDAGDGMRFIGTFDDRYDKTRLDEEKTESGGGLADLIEAGREGRIDRIIIALPQSADRRLAEITRELEQLPVTVHAVTHFSNDIFKGHRSHTVTSLGPVGLINIKKRPLSDWAPILKRTEDIVISATFLLLTLPLIALIAVAIKTTSRGPVLFRQRRHGLNQKIIEVLKFRSMTVQENGSEVRQATRNDQRVTMVGRFLRRSSLDELPQLVNVLIGDMSLVGPRPHALIHDEQWGEMLEQYANRHQVKPGITGLAQVRGLRGEARTPKDIQDRIEADLEYIGNWSIWLDVSILVRTVAAVIGAKNAH